MEIYALHKLYEDTDFLNNDEEYITIDNSYDIIDGYYLNWLECQKARSLLLEKQKNIIFESDKCSNCPIYTLPLTKRKLKNHMQEIINYCDKYNIMTGQANYDCWCSNVSIWSPVEEEIYYIETIQVKD